MASILPMAFITLLIAGVLWIGVLWAYSGRTWRFVVLVPLGVPLSALVNILIKGPLASTVGALAGISTSFKLATPLWFLVFLFLLSPVFEELIKIAPLLIRGVKRRAVAPDDAFWTGMALGIGFGLGEAAYIAWQIAASGLYEVYPWYAFTGFLGERTIVVFIHGFMTMLFTWMIARRKPLLGFVLAAGTHAIVNAGAMLYQLGLISDIVVSLWTLIVLVVCIVIFGRIRPRSPRSKPEDVIYYSTEEPP